MMYHSVWLNPAISTASAGEFGETQACGLVSEKFGSVDRTQLIGTCQLSDDDSDESVR